jgi:feruloyl-CoA hydratase/lyase
MRLINYAVPREKLKAETIALADKLKAKNPWALRATKQAYKLVRSMDYDQAEDYLAAKGAQIKLADPENGYDQGIKQFIDDKTYKPGFGPMERVKGS